MQMRSSAHQERRQNIFSDRKDFSSFYRLLDMAVITMVYFFVLAVNNVSVDSTSMILLFVCTMSYYFCAETMNLYPFGRVRSKTLMFKKISIVWCFTSVLTATVAYILPSSVPSGTDLTLVFKLALTLPVLMISRALLTQIVFWFRMKGHNTRTAIIIGTTPSACKLAHQFTEEKHLGINFVGFYEDRESSRVPNNIQYLVRGDVTKALELARSGEIDYVYIALPINAGERVVNMLKKFSNTSVQLNIIADPFVDSIINARSQQIGSIQTIRLLQTSFPSPAPEVGLSRRSN
jgi:putative colanic acid biosynthesis UDP-glucose lipid carrier transferase